MPVLMNAQVADSREGRTDARGSRVASQPDTSCQRRNVDVVCTCCVSPVTKFPSLGECLERRLKTYRQCKVTQIQFESSILLS